MISWNQYPNHILAVAEDSAGHQYGFTTRSVDFYAGQWEPIGEMQAKVKLPSDKRFSYSGSWLDSLHVRPVGRLAYREEEAS